MQFVTTLDRTSGLNLYKDLSMIGDWRKFYIYILGGFCKCV